LCGPPGSLRIPIICQKKRCYLPHRCLLQYLPILLFSSSDHRQWCVVLSRSTIGVVVVVIATTVVAAAAVAPSLPAAPPDRRLLRHRRIRSPPPAAADRRSPSSRCRHHQLPRGRAPLLALPFLASMVAHARPPTTNCRRRCHRRHRCRVIFGMILRSAT